MSSYNESCLLVNIYKKVALNYKGFYVFLLVCEHNVNVCLHLCMFTCLCGCIQMRAYVSLKNTPLYLWAVTGGKKQNECWGNGEEASVRVTIRSCNRSETRREFCFFRLLPVAFQLVFLFLALPACLPLHAPFWSHGIAEHWHEVTCKHTVAEHVCAIS